MKARRANERKKVRYAKGQPVVFNRGSFEGLEGVVYAPAFLGSDFDYLVCIPVLRNGIFEVKEAELDFLAKDNLEVKQG